MTSSLRIIYIDHGNQVMERKEDFIYCKCGYFRWGKVSRKCWQLKHFMWGLFSRHYAYFLHKGIWVLFSRGGNFREEGTNVKKRENDPRAKISMFTVLCLGLTMASTQKGLYT